MNSKHEEATDRRDAEETDEHISKDEQSTILKENEQEENQDDSQADEQRAAQLVNEIKQKLQVKLAQREENASLSANRPDETFFRSLDSSVKRNTAFVKKLRSLSEQQRESICKDLQSLNLTKYVQEVVSAITESKMKLSDVSCAVQVCSLMHRRYPDFASLLMKAIQSTFNESKEEDKSNKIGRYRVMLRLMGELITHGVFTESFNSVGVLYSILSHTVSIDKGSYDYLTVIVSFCRHCCEDFAGVFPRKSRLLMEKFNMQVPSSSIISEEKQKQFRQLLNEYHAAVVKYLEKQHKNVQRLTREHLKILHTKGELSEERKENLEKSKKLFEKFQVNVGTLSDILDLDMPDLPQDDETEVVESMGITLFTPFSTAELSSDSLWDDEETKSFYENLKDLKAVMPAIVFKELESLEDTNTTSNENNATDDPTDVMLLETIEEASEAIEELSIQDDSKEDNTVVSDTSKTDVPPSNLFDTFLRQLPTCRNRDFVDEAATEFVTNFNTKGNRRGLVQALFTVPRTRLDLLPFYSRLVATLNACFPDIGPALSVMLKKDFVFRIKKKDQIRLEEKLKAARFIGELTKFRVFPIDDAILCLRVALNNFTHHVIDMTCCLFEACGRFLIRNIDSHVRTKNLLETMMRLKSACHLEERYSIMIENAYYHCIPPDSLKEKIETRTPLQEYIRRLLIKHLITANVDKILRQIRKLPWNDQAMVDYITKLLSSPWYIKYNNIHCLANLLSGLALFRENAVVIVVDNVMEEVRLGLEINAMKLNQRRISTIKYLGELYNYRVIEADVIFNTLYSLITFGLPRDYRSNEIDPPDNYVRLRLVCVLLDTCGEFFDRGFDKARLDCFLTYLQLYHWSKKSDVFWETLHFPLEIDYLLLDLIDSLRPKMKPCGSLEEAQEAVKEFEQKYIAQLNLDGSSRQRCTSSGSQSQDITIQDGIGEDDDAADEDENEDGDVHKSQSDNDDVSFDDKEEIIDGENEEDEDFNDGKTDVNAEDDEVTVLSGGIKAITCEEDEDFMKDYEKAISEELLTRRQHSPKVPALDARLPFNRVTKIDHTKNLHSDNINFVLLTRKANKPQYKDVNIPVSDTIATKIKQKIAQEKADREEMKRLVLSHDKRQQEESLHDEDISQQDTQKQPQQRSNRSQRRSEKTDSRNTRTLEDNPDFHYMTSGMRARPH